MRLFGRKAAAPVARPALMRGLGGSVAEVPRSYERDVREGYVGNAVARRAVRIVAEAAAGAKLKGDPRVAALVAATSAGQALMETAAVHLLLHGNAYVQVLTDGAGEPAELFALRPERVTIEADARGWPTAFRYRAGDAVARIGAECPLGRPGVIHVRAMHPLDDHYGLGCLSAAAGPIAIHNAATRWNKALLDNAARPSGALVYEPGDGGTLSHEQFERLRTEMEASFAGSGNAGRPMLLEGGLRWQAMSMTPADMDFVGLKASASREIALAFGVPPMLLGLPGDATYSNLVEANRALWRLTVLPLAGKLIDAIVEALRHWWPEAALSVDLDAVPALAADRERLWGQVSAAPFLSDAEKRAMLGIEEARP